MTRRLAAILAIDMVGYSRLMEADERGVIQRQKALRLELIDPILRDRGGRVVKTTGDGLLIEFGSVVDALESAVLIQRGVSEAEAEVVKDRRIQYRAGINVGDIVIDGDDILGDGVNIAARLESLAEPGGISITASVFENVVGKLDLAFEDLGEQQVKNIQKRLRVYRVRLEMVSDAKDAPIETVSRPLKPSIAVLPFQDMSAERDQEYFADGIAEDVITGLSRNHAFLVIARNSSFTYKGKSVDVKQVAGELGVRYVLEGSVRKAGRRIRITAQLVDAATGAHVWAERYDSELDDVFAVQDAITASIVGVVAPELIGAEMQRARRKSAADLDAWDLAMRANWHGWRLTATDGAEARRYADLAIARDPTLAKPRVVRAMSDVWDVLYARSASPLQAIMSAHQMALSAVKLDERDAEAHAILGVVALFMRDYDESLRRLDSALDINPNFAFAHMWGGGFFALSGESDTARERLKEALRLSPRDPSNYWTYAFFGLADFADGAYENAAEWARKALHLYEIFPTAHRILAASCGELGDVGRAEAAVKALLAVAPGATVEGTRMGVPWKKPEHMQRYLDALRKAGLPN